MRISDWSSDVCSSDLVGGGDDRADGGGAARHGAATGAVVANGCVEIGRLVMIDAYAAGHQQQSVEEFRGIEGIEGQGIRLAPCRGAVARIGVVARVVPIGIVAVRSEGPTSELQS